MSKPIRNDYTFVKRLEKIADKYMELQREASSDTTCRKYFKICMKLYNWIDEIKEDMRLQSLQKTNNN